MIECGINGIQIQDDEEIKRYMAERETYWDYVDDELLNKPSDETHIIFYVPADSYGNETLLGVKNRLDHLKTQDYGVDLGRLDLQTTSVDDYEWLNNWKKYFKPFRVGENIIINPVWEEYDPNPNDLVFKINPGNVFGTGLHQSTKMCIASLEKTVKPGDKIADIGCGSGILCVIALMLGADYAYACDIESPALAAVNENAGLNGIEKRRYEIEIGNILSDNKMLEKLCYLKFDVVVANIVADVIISLAPLVTKFIKNEGVFIVSGIIKQRQEDVLAALFENGFSLLETSVIDEWVSFTLKFAH